jgi:hypothetical protein
VNEKGTFNLVEDTGSTLLVEPVAAVPVGSALKFNGMNSPRIPHDPAKKKLWMPFDRQQPLVGIQQKLEYLLRLQKRDTTIFAYT